MTLSPKIIFVVGPTASGKSALALELAKHLPVEIISCDAMQVYREISIANNKPSAQELKRVSHHLVDIVSIQEEFDVAQFEQRAREAVRNIHAKQCIPLIVGGSGMYMQVLLDGIFKEGDKDVGLRAQYKAIAQEKGSAYLHAELLKQDPEAAQKIHANDLKRIIRALEVIALNKKPLSKIRNEREGLWGKYDITIYGLQMDRAQLYARIDERVEDMFTRGLIEEVSRLKKDSWSQTALRIIGVQEVLGYLNKEYSLDRAKYLIKLHTRHLAKRQMTWFRKEKRLEWISLDQEDPLGTAVREILHKMKVI